MKLNKRLNTQLNNQLNSTMNRRRFFIQATKATGALALTSMTGSLIFRLYSEQKKPLVLRLGAGGRLMRNADLWSAAEQLQKSVASMSSGEILLSFTRNDLGLSQVELMNQLKSGQIDIAIDSPLYGSLATPSASFFSHAPLELTSVEKLKWLSLSETQMLWDLAYQPFGMKPLFFGAMPSRFGQVSHREITSVEEYQAFHNATEATSLRLVGDELRNKQIVMSRPLPHSVHYLNGHHHLGEHYYLNSASNLGYSFELLSRTESWKNWGADVQAVVKTAAQNVGLDFFHQRTASEDQVLEKMKAENRTPLEFSDSIQAYIAEQNETILQGLRGQNNLSAQIFESYRSFRNQLA